MKKTYILTLILLMVTFVITNVSGQLSEGGTPYSIKHQVNSENIDRIVLPAPDVDQLKSEDEFFEKNGQPARIGVPIILNISPENSGTWTEMPNGDRIWRLEIESKGARSIGVYYDSFQIPENGKLFLYSADRSQIIGAFTSKNNPKNVNFATQMVKGDRIVIEYNEFPISQEFQKTIITKEFKLDISNIIYYYKGLYADIEDTKSDPCEVNVNCSPVGDNWQDEKRGVALIDMQGYVCSGSLINNTNQDCTPYFLTAHHCNATASASAHNAWVFYFNYEASTCSGTTSSANAVTGCSVVALSDISGGSDLQLVELNSTPSASWNPYYNGWNRGTTAATGGASIHHPAGDIKKISTFTGTLQTSTWSGGQTGAHWLVYWTSNANGWGVTEGGSSGSPIFNNSGLIVGTLSGGSSYCTAQSNPDLYGKFDKHWTNGNLSSILDPAGTGATTLAGTNTPCPGPGGVVANFTGSPTTIAPGGSVYFTDASTGSITTWNWTFAGGTPSSYNGQNPPAITYTNAGTYTVTLYVSDGTNNDTETKTNYINVTTTPQGFSMDFEACTDFSTDFSPWTTNDVDGSTTYGSSTVDFANEGTAMAFIAFNASTTTPAWTGNEAHGGSRYGACFAATTPPNNDWLISNQLQLGTNSSLSFWARSITDQYGLERFKIGVSTTNNSPGSFTFITPGSYVEAPIAWTQYTYSLAAYNGQNIYIGFNCVSNDAFVFMIDDIEINTTSTNITPDINQYFSIYPNPANDFITIASNQFNDFMINITNGLGQVVYSSNNNHQKEIKLNTSEYPAGIYYVNVISNDNIYTKKISIVK